MEKKKWKEILLPVGAVLLALAAILIFSRIDVGVLCVVRRFTGYSCPGCGMTRALGAMLRLDFRAAWEYNHFCYPIVAYLCHVFGSAAVRRLRTGEWNFDPSPAWLNVVFLVLLVAWGVLRNFYHI